MKNTKKITLEEAKKFFETEKLFYNGENKFNYLDYGKYNSGFTIVLPQEWTLDENGKPENPMKFKTCNELTRGMNLDFDGDTSVMFGNYRLSKTEKPVFELKNPTQSKDVLIAVNWGGPFNRTRGQSRDYANGSNALYFTRKSSNGGGTGYDFWVLPVDYVKDMPRRDVSEILKRIEEQEVQRVENNRKIFLEREAKKQESIANKERIMAIAGQIISQIREFQPDYEVKENEANVEYGKGGFMTRSAYTENFIEEISSELERIKEITKNREEFKPLFEGMDDSLKELGAKFSFGQNYVSITGGMYDINCESYSYSQEEYNRFIANLASTKAKVKEKNLEMQREAERIKREEELNKIKANAKENGYPEKFEFYNRKYGMTGISHTYVVDKDGTIREPDDNYLRNKNHKYKYSDWLNDADGTQVYDQLYDGEIAVSYTKENSKTPYYFNVEWTDGTLTQNQIDVIEEKLDGFLECDEVKDINENNITSVKDWLDKAMKEKSVECKSLLKIDNDKKAIIDSIKSEEAKKDELLEQYRELLEKVQNAKELDDEILTEINKKLGNNQRQ